jgi:hypothetical protein
MRASADTAEAVEVLELQQKVTDVLRECGERGGQQFISDDEGAVELPRGQVMPTRRWAIEGQWG